MDWNEAERIFQELAEIDAPADSPQLLALRRQLWSAAARYANLRVAWLLAENLDDRNEIDTERTIAHNALIDSCNVLSRAMARLGLNTSWRKRVGDESTVDGRKTVGDFACYLHCKFALNAR